VKLDAVTDAGSSAAEAVAVRITLSATPVDPFAGVTVTVSGNGASGGVVSPPPPPPQAETKAAVISEASNRQCGKRFKLKLLSL